ncbi:chemotaxis protein [Sphingomonas sp. DBB INV C78]
MTPNEGPRLPKATVPSKPLAKRSTNSIDRIDQAAQELASGIGEASAAASELQRSMDQISSGAEEAAGAAQESMGLIGVLNSRFREARERAEGAQRQAEAARSGFAEVGAQIDSSVAAIELNAQRQLATLEVISSLEVNADMISGIGGTVADISDQTSLLALNATIEAERAGEIGAGFAVVADEVRVLAEASEASAGEMQELARSVTLEIKAIAARFRGASTLSIDEASIARRVIAELGEAAEALGELNEGAQQIVVAAIEAEIAAREAEKGGESIASAAEEQSAAAAEAQHAVEQQSASLEQSQQTAEALGRLTQDLRGNERDQQAVEQVAAAAEELSATVQELSGASGQILVALEQIGRGAQIQASATAEANAAMGQIETSAELAMTRATRATDRIAAIAANVVESSATIDRLAKGVDANLSEVREVLGLLAILNDTARRMEKITDNLALVSVQTSMLGVSGLVEATRAGEAGRGFATVASDIRKLSRDAAANGENAKDGVRSMQDQVATIRRDLEQIAGAAESEIGRNRAVVARFAGIADDLEVARAANQAIQAGSEDILRSAREIRGGTGQIAEAADIASNAAREASAAARQQAQAAEALAAAIEEIADIAAILVDKAG